MEPSQSKDSSSPYKPSAATGFEAVTPTLNEHRERLAREMAGLFLGPMPADEFIQTFVRGTTTEPLPSIPQDHFTKVPLRCVETKMYGPFVSSLIDFAILV